VAPGLPTGTTTGDLLLLLIENTTGTITVDGWTAAPNSPLSNGTDTTINLLYRIATGSDAVSSASIVGEVNHYIAQIVGIEEGTFNPADPFHANASGTEGAGTSITYPGVTTSIADCLIMGFAAISDDGAGQSGLTNANLSDLVETLDAATTNGNDGMVAGFAGVLDGSGGSGTTTATVPNTVKAMIVLAITPVDAEDGMWQATQPGAITNSVLRAERITSDQTIPNNTGTVLIFNSVVQEDDESSDFDLNISTGVLTIANAGWYSIQSGVTWVNDGNSTRIRMVIRQNTTILAGLDLGASGNDRFMNAATTAYLEANDTVDVQVFHTQSDAGTMDVDANTGTFLSIFKVRE
jgi:hypothetical protein